MSSLITEDIRAKATELYRGNDVCMAQARRLFKEVGFPNGLLPLRDVEECGYVEDTGFVWLKQKKEIDHKFEKINKLVRYATEVTAYVEPGKIKKLTGVKAKEIIVWVTINEITVEPSDSAKIVFKNNATGVKKVFPTDAFVVEIDEPEVFKVDYKKVMEVKQTENKKVDVDVELKEKKEVDATAAVKAVEVKDV
ncbi:hypothetical protein RND81_09G243500 [Saponaria officinalis]|uniref:Uncharacterized protein n=1 Tax=Saponaria officinalis TaxID=3572 RepID=A0AAW1IRV6_SAPOF